jgi:hypothetical protein
MSGHVYGYQPYVRIDAERLEPGELRVCRTAAAAKREAEHRVKAGKCAGATAFWCRPSDMERLLVPVVIAIFGDVPPGTCDGLPF